MNLQDCIDIIRNCTTLACEYHIKNKCDYGYEVRENRFECAKKLAINALEKQIAKKPIVQGLGQRYCSVCGCGGANHQYCARCGQKLDSEV